MTTTLTPTEVEQSQLEGMWNWFNNAAVVNRDGKVVLDFSGKLETPYGAVVQKFAAQLRAKNWIVDVQQIKNSWLRVISPIDAPARHEIRLTIVANKQF